MGSTHIIKTTDNIQISPPKIFIIFFQKGKSLHPSQNPKPFYRLGSVESAVNYYRSAYPSNETIFGSVPQKYCGLLYYRVRVQNIPWS